MMALESPVTLAPSVSQLYYILGCGFHPLGGLVIQDG